MANGRSKWRKSTRGPTLLPGWMSQVQDRDEPGNGELAPQLIGGFEDASNDLPGKIGGGPLEEAIDELRQNALRVARDDAAAGVPALGVAGLSTSEVELRERCRSVFQRWRAKVRNKLATAVAKQEQSVADKLGQASLLVDRIQRMTHDLRRSRARYSLRRQEVSKELKWEGTGRRPLSTRTYLFTVGFLALVEYFANAPVFGSLLPRDPLTERQIRLVTEMSEGWWAGAQRVLAQLMLRPDAALLALGVVTFLCVLAHFLGHACRDLITYREQQSRRNTVSSRSSIEHVIPMVITALGLMLVVGVLYEARVTLGQVGQERFREDQAVVAELRREAEWLRVDGDLLTANERANRADDMEAVAVELSEYSASMARLSFPILLLNLTLVLCGVCAAYYHRRVSHWEYFDDSTFESEREARVDAVEEASEKISHLLAAVIKGTRELRGLVQEAGPEQWDALRNRLEAVINLYRSENGRARGADPREILAFATPVTLEITADAGPIATAQESLATYDRELEHLRGRFQAARNQFLEEATS